MKHNQIANNDHDGRPRIRIEYLFDNNRGTNVSDTAIPAGAAGRPTLKGHLRIARFDHWVKNIFVLPGMLVALTIDPARLHSMSLWRTGAGVLAVGLAPAGNTLLY